LNCSHARHLKAGRPVLPAVATGGAPFCRTLRRAPRYTIRSGAEQVIEPPAVRRDTFTWNRASVCQQIKLIAERLQRRSDRIGVNTRKYLTNDFRPIALECPPHPAQDVRLSGFGVNLHEVDLLHRLLLEKCVKLDYVYTKACNSQRRVHKAL